MKRNVLLVRLAAAAAVMLTAQASVAAEFVVTSAEEIEDRMGSAQPGDVLVMANGTWVDQSIDFAGVGTASAPITLRAQTPGMVTLTGQSNLSISGSHLVVDGLNFEGGTPGNASHVVRFRGSRGDAVNSRLTNTQIKDYNPPSIDTRYFWVSLYGQNNRVDHSRFVNHNHSGVTVVAWLDGSTAGHTIDANHFVDRPEGNGNGFETIRLGTSAFNATDARIVVENNLFERVDGEIEIISNKSSNNVFRYNTIRESAGTLTLRHGRGATVEGNFILGENKEQSGGIRVIGEDHLIANNYIADVDDRADGAISLTAGVPNTPDNGYERVIDAQIINNTIVNTQGPAITLDWGFGSSDRTLLPQDVAIVNNLISSTNGPLFEGREGPGWTWQNNIAFGSGLGIAPRAGLLEVDPQLTLDPDGILRPASNSPAIDGGAALDSVTQDIDGQPRIGLLDIGADELSTAQLLRKPLVSADVGPIWDAVQPPDPPSPEDGSLVIQAEDFTSITDPNGDGDIWSAIDDADAFGARAIEAPSGSRTDYPRDTHDTLAIYEIIFTEAQDYTVYYRAKGFSGSSDSLFTPDALDADPALVETTSNNSEYRWETGVTLTIDQAHVGVPVELRIGRREGLTLLDTIVFNTLDNLTSEQLDAIVENANNGGIPGDTDGDGDIDDTDLGASISNFTGPVGAAGGKSANQGDTDGDGDVDDTDLGLSISNFTGPLTKASVPEPNALAMLAPCGLVVSQRTRGQSIQR